MRRGSVFLGVGAAAALFLSAVLASAQTDAGHLIVPGTRIGPVKIGMTITEATGIMGTPKSTRKDADGNLWFVWFENVFLGPATARSGGSGVYVVCSPQGEVLRVIVHDDPQYRTQNGAHTGMTEPELRAVMGAPLRTYVVSGVENVLVYDGIRFAVFVPARIEGAATVAGIVAEIAVFRP